jgi:hypothetical protein
MRAQYDLRGLTPVAREALFSCSLGREEAIRPTTSAMTFCAKRSSRYNYGRLQAERSVARWRYNIERRFEIAESEVR